MTIKRIRGHVYIDGVPSQYMGFNADVPDPIDNVFGYYYNGQFYKEAAHTTLITGEEGKIYVDLSGNKFYRYNGTAYVLVGGSDIPPELFVVKFSIVDEALVADKTITQIAEACTTKQVMGLVETGEETVIFELTSVSEDDTIEVLFICNQFIKSQKLFSYSIKGSNEGGTDAWTYYEINLNDMFNAKQNVISDLTTIRSNATAGAAKRDTLVINANITYATTGVTVTSVDKTVTEILSALSTKNLLLVATDSATGATFYFYPVAKSISNSVMFACTEYISTETAMISMLLYCDIDEGVDRWEGYTTDLVSVLEAKQDTISDLDTIRSNAAAGAAKIGLPTATVADQGKVPTVQNDGTYALAAGGGGTEGAIIMDSDLNLNTAKELYEINESSYTNVIVYYINNKVIVLPAYGNKLYYYFVGDNWVGVTRNSYQLNPYLYFRCLYYENGTYYLYGYNNGCKLYTSNDLINWDTSGTYTFPSYSSSSNSEEGLIYKYNSTYYYFYMKNNSNIYVSTSSDLINWSSGTLIHNQHMGFKSIEHVGSYYVLINKYGGKHLYTTDFVTWNATTYDNLKGLTYFEDAQKLVAIDPVTRKIYTNTVFDPTLDSWTAFGPYDTLKIPSSSNVTNFVKIKNIYYSYAYNNYYRSVIYSNDLIAWNFKFYSSVLISSNIYEAFSINNTFVAPALNSGVKACCIFNQIKLNDVLCDTNLFYALNYNNKVAPSSSTPSAPADNGLPGTTIEGTPYSSYDHVHPKDNSKAEVSCDFSAMLSLATGDTNTRIDDIGSICYFKKYKLYIGCLGSQSGIMYSTNGISWKKASVSGDHPSYSSTIVVSADTYCILMDSNTRGINQYYYTEDGINWVIKPISGVTGAFNSLCAVDNIVYFVAPYSYGSGYNYGYTLDGITWNISTSSGTVAYNNTLFYKINDNTLILHKVDSYSSASNSVYYTLINNDHTINEFTKLTFASNQNNVHILYYNNNYILLKELSSYRLAYYYSSTIDGLTSNPTLAYSNKIVSAQTSETSSGPDINETSFINCSKVGNTYYIYYIANNSSNGLCIFKTNDFVNVEYYYLKDDVTSSRYLNEYTIIEGRTDVFKAGTTRDKTAKVYIDGNITCRGVYTGNFNKAKESDISMQIEYKNAAGTAFANGLKFVKCTQAEYDALTTPDADTFYIIVPAPTA